jgi:hypothetical protein
MCLLSVMLCALPFARTLRVTAQGAAPRSAQNVVSTWYPIQPGDTWTYQNESRDGGNAGGIANPAVERWKTEETIVSTTSVPEGALVTQQTKVLEHEMLNGWFAPNDHTKRVPSHSYFLVRQNCLYWLREIVREEPDNIWDALDLNHQIRSQYRDALRRGTIAPEFCFPMTVGMMWGKVPDTSPADEDVWRVTAVNGDPFGVNGGTTFHMFAHEGSGEVADRWFEQGVGVLQEIREHHGTYDEDRRELLSTTLNGKTQRYRLAPARTVPYSGRFDCGGVGWQHFVRADGSPFDNHAACASYVLPASYLAR